MLAITRGTATFPDQLTKKYIIGKPLGEGSFGVVMMATRRTDHKKVIEMKIKFESTNQAVQLNSMIFFSKKKCAIKFLPNIPREDWVWDMTNVGQRIPFEIDALRRMQHPNVAAYMDHFVDKKYVIIVTELHGVDWNPANPKLEDNSLIIRDNGNGYPASNTPSKVYYDLFECVQRREFSR